MIQAVRNIVGAEPVGSAEARQLLDEGGAQMAKVLLALHTALETVESDRAFMDELQANQGRAQKSVAALRETSDVANDHKVVADSHEKQSQLYAGLLKHMKQPPKVPGMSEVEREAAQLLKGEQELKDTATASAVLGLGSVMSYFAQRTEEKQMQEKLGRSREKVKGLVSTAKKAIGDKVFVNILGSMSFQAPETEELVRHISTGLSSRAPSTCVFVTNGLPGTQEAFAKSCGNGKRLWNIVPSGCCSAFGNGTDLQIGADLAESRALYRELGDVYIVVEGGEGVAQDSQVAYQNGAVVIPLGRTGGASSGNNGFPSKALNRPPYISEERWSDIQSAKTATAKAAASAVHIIIDAINLKKQEIADHEHVHDMMEDEFQRHMKKEIVDAPFVILGVAPPEEQVPGSPQVAEEQTPVAVEAPARGADMLVPPEASPPASLPASSLRSTSPGPNAMAAVAVMGAAALAATAAVAYTRKSHAAAEKFLVEKFGPDEEPSNVEHADEEAVREESDVNGDVVAATDVAEVEKLSPAAASRDQESVEREILPVDVASAGQFSDTHTRRTPGATQEAERCCTANCSVM